MVVTKDVIKDIFYKMYFFLPDGVEDVPSYKNVFDEFWRKYDITDLNAQIKYSNSDEEVFSPKYFEKATAVDVSLNLEDSKLIEKIEEKITEDFKSVIMEIYRNIGEKRERINQYWKQHASELLFLITRRNNVENLSIKQEVQKSLSEFNDNALRFINELIQNADDCIYSTDFNIFTMLFDIEKNEIVIDASSCVIAPGLVDIHVHFRDPGFTYKEDIITGAKAAAKGGFTTVVLMANTKPTVDNEETLAYVLNKGKETEIHVETCVSITKGLQGKELTDMKTLIEKGAVGVTDDGIPLLDEDILKRAMIIAKELDVPISLHEENPAFIKNNGVNAGKAAANFGIGGSDRKAEITLIERDVELALQTGASLNVQHSLMNFFTISLWSSL